ncbi:succinate dehydrogenase assembly factor 2 [Sandarakinorhabdus sp.]|uniref:FAD assembly factor SdhE n=1 Tax=Sandarakinorhabdus sp. TaxID=1916663 RepID=UPI00286EB16E|nr:succinate dehydrogenase assembly factor 2 [Sandarakinorhabdus sp.]
MDIDHRLRRMKFRAWHRGTKEADLLIGGFCDRYAAGWTDAEMTWFEAILEEQDVDVMAWALGTAVPPDAFCGAQMDALLRLDYVAIAMR